MNGERQVDAADSDSGTRRRDPLSPYDFDASVVETWSCIQPKVIPFSHTWTIRDYSFFIPNGIRNTEDLSIQSSVFLTNTESSTSKWFLKLTQPKDDIINSYPYISLSLHLFSSDEFPVVAKVNLSVLNAELEKTTVRHSGSIRFNGEYNHNVYSLSGFVERGLLSNKNNGLLPNDTLTIKCEINLCVEETIRISSQSSKDVGHFVRELKLANQLKSLLDRKQMSDVTLSAGDQEFPAHKAILVARSPVFAAMFEHDMMEERQNKVTISDIDPKVVEEMLVFIYTDKSPNLKDMAKDLLVAADKYDIVRLKGMCEEFLCTKISAHNAVEILSLADRHNAEVLKNQATNYIALQATRLMKTQAWKDLLVKNENLVSEAFKEETFK